MAGQSGQNLLDTLANIASIFGLVLSGVSLWIAWLTFQIARSVKAATEAITAYNGAVIAIDTILNCEDNWLELAGTYSTNQDSRRGINGIFNAISTNLDILLARWTTLKFNTSNATEYKLAEAARNNLRSYLDAKNTEQHPDIQAEENKIWLLHDEIFGLRQLMKNFQEEQRWRMIQP